jgi:adenylate kinase
MIIAISGTPGTGKTAVSNLLKKNGYLVIELNEIAIKNDFISGIDKKRNSKIIDINRLNEYISEKYVSEELIFIEGHAAHFLNSAEKVILLRCKPKKLKKRLEKKGWNETKIKENIEAEALDVILCETIEHFSEDSIFEIDTSNKQINSIVLSILEIIKSNFEHIKKYNIGKIDWSEDILKDF